MTIRTHRRPGDMLKTSLASLHSARTAKFAQTSTLRKSRPPAGLVMQPGVKPAGAPTAEPLTIHEVVVKALRSPRLLNPGRIK